jgi:hypothetical protein
MRLITGADLDADDVAAILEGEGTRLAKSWSKELVDSGWPDDVRRGVELLGWMVARGMQEVRVAFRVHGSKGDPLPADSKVDGYVHEKWALFEDAFGNCIRVSGSLNESKTALVRNAENISLDLSWWNFRLPKGFKPEKGFRNSLEQQPSALPGSVTARSRSGTVDFHRKKRKDSC